MFPKFTEFIADEQPKSRLAEAERFRLVKAFQQEKPLTNIKHPVARKVLSVLLYLI
jgi:hypothetical protein